MKQNTAALFDLDGVLIDSETLYTDFWSKMGKDYNLPSPTFAHDIKGRTLKSILDEFFADEPLRSEITGRIHEFEDNIYYPVFDGVTDFLHELRLKGIPTAIVTSSDNVKMKYLFKQHPELEEAVDYVVDGSMVTKSKPDPEGYLMAAKALGVNPQDAYVFEDSFQGLEAGRRAGCTVIALATTNSAESLKGKAHAIINGWVGFNVEKMKSVSKL